MSDVVTGVLMWVATLLGGALLCSWTDCLYTRRVRIAAERLIDVQGQIIAEQRRVIEALLEKEQP